MVRVLLTVGSSTLKTHGWNSARGGYHCFSSPCAQTHSNTAGKSSGGTRTIRVGEQRGRRPIFRLTDGEQVW